MVAIFNKVEEFRGCVDAADEEFRIYWQVASQTFSREFGKVRQQSCRVLVLLGQLTWSPSPETVCCSCDILKWTGHRGVTLYPEIELGKGAQFLESSVEGKKIIVIHIDPARSIFEYFKLCTHESCGPFAINI